MSDGQDLDTRKPAPENYLVEGMSDAEYHADRTRMSKHTLEEFARNPWKFAKQAETPPQEEESAAFAFGRAVHAAVLTPQIFSTQYALQPEEIKVRRGKAWEAFVAENAGKEILKLEDWNMAHELAFAVERHEDAARVLNACAKRELTAHWVCDGVKMKSRFDAASKNLTIVADLKTCQSADEESFMKDANAYGYDVQAAMYLDAARACGADPRLFAFVCVEKAWPFAVAVYTFDDASDFVQAGRAAYRSMLADYKALQALTDGEARPLPGYPTRHNLPPVAWSKNLKKWREQTCEPLKIEE